MSEDISNPSYLQESGMPHVPQSNNNLNERKEEVISNSNVDEFGLPVQNMA